MNVMTNTGETVQIQWQGRSSFDGALYIGTTGITMAQAATIFGSAKATKKLHVTIDEQNPDGDGGSVDYTGFTVLTHLHYNDIEGTVVVGLRRQEATE